MSKRFTIPAIVLILINGVSAQGFLGRLKQEAIDTGKKVANEAGNQSAPSDDMQKGTGNQMYGNQDASVEKQREDEEQRKKELERQTAERNAAIAKEQAEYEKRWADDQAQAKKLKADQEAEQAKLDAQWKADNAKREEERVKLAQRQKEEAARQEKKQEEKIAQEKQEARNRIFDALRTGNNIKTAEHAKTQLMADDLWQDGMEVKIKEVIAERMSKAAQNKFPLSDMFKTPIKLYKEFESGMSLEWCKAKLETEGSNFDAIDDDIILEMEDSEVKLIFKKVTSEKQPILTAGIVKLPASITHSQVLEKFKREIPNATFTHVETPHNLPAEKNYVKDGISLDGQFAVILLKDTVSSSTQAVTIETKLLVGKAYLIYHADNRKVLVYESSRDGVVMVPAGLDVRQQEAASVIATQMLLSETGRTAVLIEDKAMLQALKVVQQEEQKNEKNKQQQKNAAALAF